MKDYTMLEILEYIIENYKDSCISSNIVNYKDYKSYNEDQIETIFLDELESFFTYELIGICGCGTPNDCKKDILDLLNILYSYINHSKMISDEAIEIKQKAMKERFDTYNIYDNSLLSFMVYILNDKGILDHGSGIGGSWITDLGNMCRIVYTKILEEK